MRVLLVEDDTRVAAALETALRQHGHDIAIAATGEAALAAAPTDLVLLDRVLLRHFLRNVSARHHAEEGHGFV